MDRVRDALMLSLGDYLKSYDHAKLQATLTVYPSTRVEQEKVMGKCIQRVAYIKKALDGGAKASIKDALTQCLEDCNAAYEDARNSAETTLIIAERTQHEKTKARCIDRRRMLKTALDEIT